MMTRPAGGPRARVPALGGTGRLADDLYLIAHHELTGRPQLAPRAVGLGLAGALLGELVLAGAVSRDAGQRHGDRPRLRRGVSRRRGGSGRCRALAAAGRGLACVLGPHRARRMWPPGWNRPGT